MGEKSVFSSQNRDSTATTGSKIITSCGMKAEVIYTGFTRREQIVAAAIQEDVDAWPSILPAPDYPFLRVMNS
jgi:hypothetical protein